MTPAQTRPSVVFVHGSGDSAKCWREQIAFLGSEQALAVDLPGHGTRVADPGPQVMSVRDYALDVRGQMQAVGIMRPVVAGHSLGGAIVLQLALEWAEELSGLILIGTGARLRVLPALLEAAQRDQDAALQQIRGLGPQRADALPPATHQPRPNPENERTPLAPGIFYRDLAACDSFDVMAVLHQITLPSLVVCGEEDRMTPPKYAEYLRAHLPHATLQVIPGAGHDVMRDQPQALNGVIGAWLQSAFGK